MRVRSKTDVILHFDPLSPIFVLTGNGFSKLARLHDLITHQRYSDALLTIKRSFLVGFSGA